MSVRDGVAEPERSWGNKLASIHVGSPENRSSELTRVFEAIVRRVQKKCGPSSSKDVADALVRGRDVLRKKFGVREDLLTFSNAVDASIPDGAGIILSLNECVAAYITIRASTTR